MKFSWVNLYLVLVSRVCDDPKHSGRVDAVALIGADLHKLGLTTPPLSTTKDGRGEGEGQEPRGVISSHPHQLSGAPGGPHERRRLLVIDAQQVIGEDDFLSACVTERC